MMIRNAIPDVSELTGADYPNVVSITADETYWQEQPPTQLMWGYFWLELFRLFEQRLLEQEITDLVHGPIHSSIGQEAVAVGTALALTSDDKITSTHRAHHHFLAKAIAHYAPPQEEFKSYRDNSDLRDCVRRTMAEIMGLDVGWVGGRGGSMHLFDDQSGNIGTQAIVAGNVPYAAGIAFAENFAIQAMWQCRFWAMGLFLSARFMKVSAWLRFITCQLFLLSRTITTPWEPPYNAPRH